jgi:hypothetical protein
VPAPTKRVVQVFSDTSLIAALAQVQSAWLDHSSPSLFITRTSTNGTYAFEIDWSRDGGSTIAQTDTITTTGGVTAVVPTQGRWARLRVKNTHATLAFTAHSTVVEKDVGTGR